MRAHLLIVGIAGLGMAGCGPSAPAGETQSIQVTSAEQQGLHKLDAINLAIALKRSIYDAGATCDRVTDAGFVGTYQNLDMWMASCTYRNGAKRDWAVFAGPDGSAQVRDCKDVGATGLPACAIKERPEGDFNKAG